MGRGALVLYLETKENAEVAEGAGVPFTRSNLAERIGQVLGMSEEERNEFRTRAVSRIRERYSWDAVTAQYEALFSQLLACEPVTC